MSCRPSVSLYNPISSQSQSALNNTCFSGVLVCVWVFVCEQAVRRPKHTLTDSQNRDYQQGAHTQPNNLLASDKSRSTGEGMRP